MLKRFNVKNVYSFSAAEDGRSEEFSMIAGKVRSKKGHRSDDGTLRLLKFSAIYGANASGKSNLVKAMSHMRSIVLREFPEGHTEKYGKVDPERVTVSPYALAASGTLTLALTVSNKFIVGTSSFEIIWIFHPGFLYRENTGELKIKAFSGFGGVGGGEN